VQGRIHVNKKTIKTARAQAAAAARRRPARAAQALGRRNFSEAEGVRAESRDRIVTDSHNFNSFNVCIN
jgi:hypothetical protein